MLSLSSDYASTGLWLFIREMQSFQLLGQWMLSIANLDSLWKTFFTFFFLEKKKSLLHIATCMLSMKATGGPHQKLGSVVSRMVKSSQGLWVGGCEHQSCSCPSHTPSEATQHRQRQGWDPNPPEIMPSALPSKHQWPPALPLSFFG